MRPFDNVRDVRPGRSLFDLSYDKKLTCDMGQLIPILCDEAVPGDVWDVANGMVVRFQPLVAPIMHEVSVRVDYYFVPYRLLWTDWENFITGGVDGNNASVLPRWTTTSTAPGTLWDYMGMPTDVVPTDALPLDFPKRAYNLVWNQYYRDETLQSEISIANNVSAPYYVAWEKDYFTAALPWQQRGTAPALPISGMTSAVWADSMFGTSATYQDNVTVKDASGAASKFNAGTSEQARLNLKNSFNMNTVDLSVASTFDIADFRLAFAVQKWMERNARCGARYTEYLQGHFGVSPRDERLQRAEYIGGTRSPIIVSEVLKTGTTDATSPQGNMAGHGLAADGRRVARYHVQEFGLVLGLMNIKPKPAYQQGIDRQWLRRSRYDFYHPEFANLSEQGIELAELYATNDGTANRTVFGFAGRYDEMRYKRNQVNGLMRTTYAYWHLGRVFGSQPALNGSFIACNPDKRIFAVPSAPGLIVNFHNALRVLRPLPIQAEPGLVDHTYGGM